MFSVYIEMEQVDQVTPLQTHHKDCGLVNLVNMDQTTPPE